VCRDNSESIDLVNVGKLLLLLNVVGQPFRKSVDEGVHVLVEHHGISQGSVLLNQGSDGVRLSFESLTGSRNVEGAHI